MKFSYYLKVKYKIKKNKVNEFIDLINRLEIKEKSENEEGCIKYEYEPVTVGEEEAVLVLNEIWVNKEFEQRHLLSEHIEAFKKVKDDYVENTEIEEYEAYVSNVCKEKVDAIVEVPGSKSVTNRALLIAALSEEETFLEGVLFSDDSRHFLSSLKELGFELDISEKDKTVKIRGTGGRIPNKTRTIDVGSAGTAARFLTAMLALSEGEYTINCSKQMEKRPMKPLFDVLIQLGAKFTYLNKEGYLPVKVKGNGRKSKDITMDISKSTQFLSAMLMVMPILENDITITIASEKKTGSYIGITMDMLKDFGVNVVFDGNAYYIKGKQKVKGGNYIVEPDVSAACYFYAAAAITGGRVIVKNIRKYLMQGDMKFIELLGKIGCIVNDTPHGIEVIGPENGIYNGIDIDMNNFSDQALTLAAVATFAKTKTVIRNVGHIRGQECDRMAAIIKELSKCGIDAKEDGNNIVIIPGKLNGAIIETYDDHRVAMAFSLLTLKNTDVIITNPMCCRKTFEEFYEVFSKL